jgi:nucleotide-binding universal stress UspA family protein
MRLQKIVIGMDFSDAAISAAKWTSEHIALNAELVLVHVIDPPHQPLFARSKLPSPETVERAAWDFAETRFIELTRVLGAASLRHEIRIGKPADVIPAIAAELDADLVVIGPHGERPNTAKFLGSTADRVVRLSSVPVLVATNPRPSAPRRLLVPVDDSRIMLHLLDVARDLALAFNAELTLFHVISNAVYSHVASMSYATSPDEESARREIREELEAEGRRWLDQLTHTGLDDSRVHAHVTHGHAGDAAVEMANRMDADLIVLGRKGRGLVAPALLGSTVGTVLHGARCPVLVVTEDEHRETLQTRL